MIVVPPQSEGCAGNCIGDVRYSGRAAGVEPVVDIRLCPSYVGKGQEPDEAPGYQGEDSFFLHRFSLDFRSEGITGTAVSPSLS